MKRHARRAPLLALILIALTSAFAAIAVPIAYAIPATYQLQVFSAEDVDISNTTHASAAVYARLTLSGSSGDPTGTADFSLFSGSGCSGSPSQTFDNVLVNGGTATIGGQIPLLPGSYSFSAHYDGNSPYDAGDSACVNFTLTKPNPSSFIVFPVVNNHNVSDETVATGSSVKAQSLLDGTFGNGPTGTVDFVLYSSASCTIGSEVATYNNVAITLPSSGPPQGQRIIDSPVHVVSTPGPYAYKAHYDGDDRYNPFDTTCVAFAAGVPLPSIDIKVHDSTHADVTGQTLSPLAYYHPLVQITGNSGTPTGTIDVDIYSGEDCLTKTSDVQDLALNLGALDASFSVRFGPGFGGFIVHYSGDGTYGERTSECVSFAVDKASPTVTTLVHTPSHTDVTGGSHAIDTPVHIAGTVTPPDGWSAATGQYNALKFSDSACTTGINNGNVNVPLPASGQVESLVTLQEVGTFYVRVDYVSNGDPQYKDTQGNCVSITLTKATPNLTLTVRQYGNDVAGGTILPNTAVDMTMVVDGPLADSAALGASVSFLIYPNSNCGGSSIGGAINTVAGDPPTAAYLNAVFTTESAWSMRAAFSENASYLSANSNCVTFTVDKGTPSFDFDVINADTQAVITPGATLPFGTRTQHNVVISAVGSPDGFVDMLVYTDASCSTLSNDLTELNLLYRPPVRSTARTLLPGTYSYRAHYDGDALFDPGDSDCISFTISKTTPHTFTQIHNPSHTNIAGTTIPAGVQAHAFVSFGSVNPAPAPTGTVNFLYYNTSNCTGQSTAQNNVAIASQTAESTPLLPTPGSHSYRVHYNGDTNYAATDGSCVSFNSVQGSIAFDVQFRQTGSPVLTSVRIHLSGPFGNPTGTIDIMVFAGYRCDSAAAGIRKDNTKSGRSGNGNESNVPLTNGSATSTPVELLGGTYSYRIHYDGDSQYLASTSDCFIVVPPTLRKPPTG